MIKIFKLIKTEFFLIIYKILYYNKIKTTGIHMYGSGFNISLSGKNAKIVLHRSTSRLFFNIRVENGQLSIGEYCAFNNFCSINCLNKVNIGNNVLFGENVKIYDHNHNYKSINKLIRHQGMDLGVISIGNNCWIGSNVVILKDVVIGDNVIIGAGSIVTKSIPSNVIAVGNPCKEIQKRKEV